MNDSDNDTIANRDEPIPVIDIPLPDENDHSSDEDTRPRTKRAAFKRQASKLKGKIESVKDGVLNGTVQDRLLNSLLGQIIPAEYLGGDDSPTEGNGTQTYVERPSFSLPTMSTNFRRFNARVGVLFVFQNRMERLFSWRTPSHTLSFLAVYTLICLQPALIPLVPLGLLLLFVMIPSFLTRHPPPKSPSENTFSLTSGVATEMDSAWSSYAYTTHPTAPARRVIPAAELSKDFFRNMRDLQNSMEDFSRLHDAVIAHVSPYTDFSDERLSSSVFLLTFASLLVATVAAHLVPWRIVSLLGGWALTLMGHPQAQAKLSHPEISTTTKQAHAVSRSWLLDWINSDIVLDAPPEIREVEIFELQHRRRKLVYSPATKAKIPATATNLAEVEPVYDGDDENWEPWLYTPSPHDPLCPQRLSGAWPAGTQFFEEVTPPPGWLWRDKKWTLDLLSEAWVEERCVTGVEVERQGGRWVYDIAYQETDNPVDKKGGKKLKKKSIKSWEEGNGQEKKGEWRRRRWVRLVERRVQKVSEMRNSTVYHQT